MRLRFLLRLLYTSGCSLVNYLDRSLPDLCRSLMNSLLMAFLRNLAQHVRDHSHLCPYTFVGTLETNTDKTAA
jgi:hypothetical protein